MAKQIEFIDGEINVIEASINKILDNIETMALRSPDVSIPVMMDILKKIEQFKQSK